MGGYSITKMIAQSLELEANNQNDDARGIPLASSKCNMPSDFFKISSTIKMINECSRLTNLEHRIRK